MEKKNVLKVCALGLCAATVFTSGVIKEYRTQNKVLSTENIVYKSGNITDKYVTSVRMERRGNTDVFLYGVNVYGEFVWNNEVGIDSENNPYVTSGDAGNEYYFLNFNGKLYALNLQTGKVVWSTKSAHIASNNENYIIKHLEAGDKLVEVAGVKKNGKINLSTIIIYDLKTGKYLKSIKNVEEKYITPNNSEGNWNYYLSDLVLSYSKGVAYIEIDSRSKIDPSVTLGGTQLKIDVNNYKIQFSKSDFDIEFVDEEVVDVKIDNKVVGNKYSLYVNATNSEGETIWQRDLGTVNYGTILSFPNLLGEKYYYIQYNGKLYALDIQTGNVVWSAKSDFKGYLLETNDKLVEITGGKGSIVVRDIKTGKVLKSASKLVETYVKKDAVVFAESFYEKNGIVYVEVDGLTHHANGGASADHMIGYLKIDTKNYSIKFVSDERPETGIWD